MLVFFRRLLNFILVGTVVIGDKLVAMFRLQDGLNVICLFV